MRRKRKGERDTASHCFRDSSSGVSPSSPLTTRSLVIRTWLFSEGSVRCFISGEDEEGARGQSKGLSKRIQFD